MAAADESKPTTNGSEGNPAGGAPGAAGALVRTELPEEPGAEGEERDRRLERMPMQLDVMVRAASLRVEDLLRLERGTVVETVHEHSQDVPVLCGRALLVWGEFEVMDQKLAVRITRLA